MEPPAPDGIEVEVQVIIRWDILWHNLGRRLLISPNQGLVVLRYLWSWKYTDECQTNGGRLF